MNDLSLKILAYIIKGFFLTIKKSYENFSRDLDIFIDVNVHGLKPKLKKIKDGVNDMVGNLNSITLISDNTQFDRIMTNPIIATQINKTLKKISNFHLLNLDKKIGNVDFSAMTDEEKRDYLKKNFIQALTDNLTQEINNLNMNLESSTENFANMINFNMGNLNDDIEMEEVYNGPNINVDDSEDFRLEFISEKKVKHGNAGLKFDEKLEFNVDKFLNRLNKLDKLESLIEETVS
jgi:hypothetical protein